MASTTRSRSDPGAEDDIVSLPLDWADARGCGCGRADVAHAVGRSRIFRARGRMRPSRRSSGRCEPDKEFFTPEEAKAYVRQRLSAASGDENIEADKQHGNVGSYNDAWMDRGNDIVPTRRTSLIVDPKSGRVPPFIVMAVTFFLQNRNLGLTADRRHRGADQPGRGLLIWGRRDVGGSRRGRSHRRSSS